MKRKIIDTLKNAAGKFVSGENIANELNVTRTSIWKNINSLRKLGYDIESHVKLGYKLNQIADVLLPAAVQSGLNTKIIGVNEKMIHKFSVDSTNNLARKLAYHGAADGFFSPPGKGIYFSLILHPKCLPKDAPKFTLMAAVAVANAMKRFNLPAQIKWPNDIMFDGRKIVGILTEMSAQIEQVNYIVVGIGINCNVKRDEFPEDIRDVAASLSEINGEKISRVDLFRAILEELDKLYNVVNESGFAEILKRWREFNITLGKNVTVISAETGDTFTGVAVDIDEDGALIVKTESGLQTVYAGDVSVRN